MNNDFSLDFIYQNNYVDIIHDACKLCYKGKPEKTFNDKLKYIEDKVRLGHESVIEHSNVIILITIHKDNLDGIIEMSEIFAASRDIKYKLEYYNDKLYYLIAGNIRAYKNIFRNISNQYNKIAKILLNELYNIPKELFYDFIQNGIMSEKLFKSNNIIQEKMISGKIINDNTIKIINMDRICNIDFRIFKIINKCLFTLDDLLDLCNVTVLFKDVSRIITQQITRHRNSISQQSQRYVDEGEAYGNNPLNYTNYLPKDMKFDIDRYGKIDLDELSKEMMKIYVQLRKQGLKKEDARFYLPQNVQSSLYMTFTYKSLIHYIKVRMDSAAQHENRLLAESLYNVLHKKYAFLLGDDMFKYLEPKYK